MVDKVYKTIDRESKKKQPGIKGFLHWWLENSNNKKMCLIDIGINIIILISIYFVYLDYTVQDSPASYIRHANDAFLVFFVIEYLLRLFVSTDFLSDWKKEGGSLLKAIGNKIAWMCKFFSLIDLIAILPAIRYLRILRTARILRLVRLLRFVRVLKVFRNCEKYFLTFRGLTQNWRVYLFFILGTIGLVSVLSFGIYFFEVNASTGKFDSYSKSFLHSLKLLKLADDTPASFGGRTFSSLVNVGYIFFFAVIISLITAQLRETMENVKKGRLGDIKLKDHVVLCGLTTSTRQVIDDLLLSDKSKRNYIVLITLKEDPDINGVLYVHGDFSDPKVLASVNIGDASECVIFAEDRENEEKKITDMRTMLTVFHIEKDFPKVHTICELIFKENAEIIKSKIEGDEFIFKEVIDANLISRCIKINHLSPFIYELLNCDGKQLQEKKLNDFGLSPVVSFRELKQSTAETDYVVLGIMRNGNEPILAPSGEFAINGGDRIIVLGEAAC